jgi:lupus La protein
MSNLNVETTEPDPAVTSLPIDETVNKEGGDLSAPTDKGVVVVEAKDTNGITEVEEKETAEKNEAVTNIKAENGDEKTEENGTPRYKKQRTYDNGVLKTSGQVQEGEGARNSKYDPSILPTTDDPSKIRAQVCSSMTLLPTPVTDVACKGRILFWRCKPSLRQTSVEPD